MRVFTPCPVKFPVDKRSKSAVYSACLRQTDTADNRKAAPVLQHRDGGKEADMYTEYGYMVNGVEYATIDEALAALDDD